MISLLFSVGYVFVIISLCLLFIASLWKFKSKVQMKKGENVNLVELFYIMNALQMKLIIIGQVFLGAGIVCLTIYFYMYK